MCARTNLDILILIFIVLWCTLTNFSPWLCFSAVCSPTNSQCLKPNNLLLRKTNGPPARFRKMNLWIRIVGGYEINAGLLIIITVYLCICITSWAGIMCSCFLATLSFKLPQGSSKHVRWNISEWELCWEVCVLRNIILSRYDTCGQLMTVRHWLMSLFSLDLQARWEQHGQHGWEEPGVRCVL